MSPERIDVIVAGRLAACSVALAVLLLCLAGPSGPAAADGHAPRVGTFETGGVVGLNDIALLPDGTAWGVGDGIIGHWDGRTWRRAVDRTRGDHSGSCGPAGVTWQAVDFRSLDRGIAVGHAGAVWHFRDGRWREQPRFTAQDLLEVAIGAGGTWALSAQTIWHRGNDDDGWRPVDPAVYRARRELTSLLVDDTRVVVGGNRALLALEDGQWRDLSKDGWRQDEQFRIEDLAWDAHGHLWAVGGGWHDALVAEWDGERWARHTVEGLHTAALAIAFGEDGIGWLGVYDFGETVESLYVRAPGATQWRPASMWCDAPDGGCGLTTTRPRARPDDAGTPHSTEDLAMTVVAFAGGAGWAASDSVLVRLEAQRAYDAVWYHSTLHDMAITEYETWAVGAAVLRKTDDLGWRSVERPDADGWSAIDGTLAGRVLMTAGPSIFEWRDGTWRRTLQSDDELYDVALDGDGGAWMVGAPPGETSGVILEYRDGVLTKRLVLDGPDARFLELVVEGRVGFAIAEGGRVARYDGDRWQLAPVVSDEPLYSPSIDDGGGMWAARADALMEHTAAGWQVHPLPDFAEGAWQILDIVARSAGEVWVVAGFYDRSGSLIRSAQLLRFQHGAWFEYGWLPCTPGDRPRLFASDRLPFHLLVTGGADSVMRVRVPAPDGASVFRALLPYAGGR